MSTIATCVNRLPVCVCTRVLPAVWTHHTRGCKHTLNLMPHKRTYICNSRVCLLMIAQHQLCTPLTWATHHHRRLFHVTLPRPDSRAKRFYEKFQLKTTTSAIHTRQSTRELVSAVIIMWYAQTHMRTLPRNSATGAQRSTWNKMQ